MNKELPLIIALGIGAYYFITKKAGATPPGNPDYTVVEPPIVEPPIPSPTDPVVPPVVDPDSGQVPPAVPEPVTPPGADPTIYIPPKPAGGDFALLTVRAERYPVQYTSGYWVRFYPTFSGRDPRDIARIETIYPEMPYGPIPGLPQAGSLSYKKITFNYLTPEIRANNTNLDRWFYQIFMEVGDWWVHVTGIGPNGERTNVVTLNVKI